MHNVYSRVLLVFLCFQVANSQACSADCLDKKNDTMCDTECFTLECEWDGGDCENETCAEGCLTAWNANGTCEAACNNTACEFDGGDCCSADCLGKKNDTTCNIECFTLGCEWDGGDCKNETCAEGCLTAWKKDYICQPACNNEDCEKDGGDCEYCADGCSLSMRDNDTCNDECYNSLCNWDNFKCNDTCVAGCNLTVELLNGVCDDACNVAICEFDVGNCECKNNGCSDTLLGNGVCDLICNIAACNYDSNSCNGLLYSTVAFNITTTSSSEASSVEENNYGKIAGVGLGVFLTIMAMVLGVILCLIGTSTPVFFIFLVLGLLLPVVTFMVVAFAPTHTENVQNEDDRTDFSIITRNGFLALMVLSALFAMIKSIDLYFGVNLRARRVDSKIGDAPTADLRAQQASEPVSQTIEMQNLNPTEFPER